MWHFLIVQAAATAIGGLVFAVSKGNTPLAGWTAGTVYWMLAAWRFI